MVSVSLRLWGELQFLGQVGLVYVLCVSKQVWQRWGVEGVEGCKGGQCGLGR